MARNTIDRSLLRDADDEDPIPEVQNTVREASALVGCLKETLQGMGGNTPDLEAACDGIIRILNNVWCELDPMAFRQTVLASKPAKVNHDEA